jgi:hypothetical protein
MSRYFLFFFILLFISCRELVKDDFPPFEKSTIINAFFSSDSIIKIYLSETGSMGTGQLIVIEDAIVHLYLNDSIVQFHHIDNGVYSSNLIVPVNIPVRCEIYHNNILSEAACVIPEPPEIKSVRLYPKAWINDDGMSSPAIECILVNNPDKTLYFEARVKFFRKGLYDNESSRFSYNEEQTVALFTNTGENGSTILKYFEFTPNIWSTGDKHIYILEIRALSKEAYEYLKSLKLYESGRFPEFGTGSVVPYNIYSNIQNGYGIFAGFSAVKSDTLQ